MTTKSKTVKSTKQISKTLTHGQRLALERIGHINANAADRLEQYYRGEGPIADFLRELEYQEEAVEFANPNRDAIERNENLGRATDTVSARSVIDGIDQGRAVYQPTGS